MKPKPMNSTHPRLVPGIALVLATLLTPLLITTRSFGQVYSANGTVPAGPAFTYQGRLTDNDVPINTSLDFQFKLFDSQFGGNQVGLTLTNFAITPSNGLFTTMLDFGYTPFGPGTNNAGWLEVSMRTNGIGTNFYAFDTRQQLTASPYALFSATANLAQNVGSNAIADGSITLPKISTAGAFNGSVLGYNGSNAVWQGIIGQGPQAVVAGPGLVGGGSNGTITLSITNGGITLSMISTVNASQGALLGFDGTNAVWQGVISSGPPPPVGIIGQAPARGSVAAGSGAEANDPGTFVWADSSTTNWAFPSITSNEFAVRATGGVRFVSAINNSNGNPTAGVSLAPGGGSWSSLSDRNAKSNLQPVDSREILDRVAQMPISTWNYNSQDTSVRHLGPMAQDFATAFGLGEDDKHITTIDADGVALAAIQGLNQLVKEKNAELETLKAQNRRLEERLDALENRLSNPGNK